ncbi:MAG: hypothetical protein E1N59_3144 [Puniceicoccaceae bacterium 5H]|nr:MAG: hypothetical protein E1N59_3144 [Puniceicoccaceae bacterium 5H]
MKRNYLLLALMLFAALPLFGQANAKTTADPAYIDVDQVISLDAIQPEVNINLPRFLLLNATKDLADQNEEIASIVQEVKHLRLLVFQPKEGERENILSAAQQLRQRLDTEWTPILSVPEEGVGFYAKSDESGEQMAGLAALITPKNGDQMVFMNLVGNVPLNKVIKLASNMDDPEIQELLANVQGSFGGGNGTGAAPQAPKAPEAPAAPDAE